MIIHHRRQGQSMRADRNKSHTLYSEWKAERQASLDARSPFQLIRDRRYQGFNKNESYYTGLPDRIQDRQDSKMPVAGQGAVTFFGDLTTVLKLGSKLVPLFIPVYLLSRVTEEVAKEKSGLR